MKVKKGTDEWHNQEKVFVSGFYFFLLTLAQTHIYTQTGIIFIIHIRTEILIEFIADKVKKIRYNILQLRA